MVPSASLFGRNELKEIEGNSQDIPSGTHSPTGVAAEIPSERHGQGIEDDRVMANQAMQVLDKLDHARAMKLYYRTDGGKYTYAQVLHELELVARMAAEKETLMRSNGTQTVLERRAVLSASTTRQEGGCMNETQEVA